MALGPWKSLTRGNPWTTESPDSWKTHDAPRASGSPSLPQTRFGESGMNDTVAPDPLVIGSRTFSSRLLVGTGKYVDFQQTREAIDASGAEIVTVAIRRINIG